MSGLGASSQTEGSNVPPRSKNEAFRRGRLQPHHLKSHKTAAELRASRQTPSRWYVQSLCLQRTGLISPITGAQSFPQLP